MTLRSQAATPVKPIVKPEEATSKTRVRPSRTVPLGPEFSAAGLVDKLSARQAHEVYLELKKMYEGNGDV
jgi:hypothetical protein